MKFTTEMTVIGMKRSKGQLDNGTTFDSTKVYGLTDLDASKGDAKGQFSSEYQFGTSVEYAKFEHLPFPFKAQADLEITTNGKSTKTVIVGLKPVSAAPAPKAA